MSARADHPAAGAAFDSHGRRVVGLDVRVNIAAQALASELWQGGSDEHYHFLLYLCGRAATTVLDAADCYEDDESSAAATDDTKVCGPDAATWRGEPE